MRSITLFLLLATFVSSCFAQITSIPYEPVTHYYLVQPNEKELKDFVLKKKFPSSEMLKRSVHSSTDIPVSGELPELKGTYFLFSVSEEDIYLQLWNQVEYGLMIHRHQGLVLFHLTDPQGKEITDAKVRIYRKNKEVNYNTELKAYVFKWRPYSLPIISVEHEGANAFYNMSASKNELVKRKMKKPKKIHTSLLEGYSILSQAKYRPSDTLRFSSKVVEKGESCARSMYFKMIQTSPEYLEIDTNLLPNEHGIYTLEMPVPDSFKLDQRILVVYEVNAKKDYLRGNLYFTIEEYELDETDLDAQLLQENDSVFIRINALDNNGFPKYGSDLKIELIPGDITQLNSSAMYFDDNIWELDTVANDRDIKIAVPDSLARLFLGGLKANVTLITPNNERFLTSAYHSIERKFLTINIDTDSTLKIKASRNAQEVEKDAILHYTYGNQKTKIKVKIPLEMELDPNIRYSHIEIDEQLYNIYSLPKLSHLSFRKDDTAVIRITNKRELDVHYKLYKNHKLLADGSFKDHQKQWEFTDEGESSYFMIYWYTWEGSVKEYNINLHPNEKSLQMQIDQKESIFPGERTDIELTLKDHRGRPLPNVAITSTSVSNQFKQSVDYEIEDYNPTYYNPYIYRYNQVYFFNRSLKKRLDNEWLKVFDLENSQVHKMHVPGSELLLNYIPLAKNELNPKAKHFGYFNPFLFKDGHWSNIVYVKFNNSLVYDRAIKPLENIMVKEGYYTVNIRTQKHLYTIDSVRIRAGQKLIMSFDEEEVTGLRVKKKGKKLKKDIQELHADQVALVFNKSGSSILVESPGDETEFIPHSGYQTVTKAIGPYHRGDILYFKLKNRWFMAYYKEHTRYIVTDDKLIEQSMDVFTPAKQKLGKYGYKQQINAIAKTTTDMEIEDEYLFEPSGITSTYEYPVFFVNSTMQNHIIKDVHSTRSYHYSFYNGYSKLRLEPGTYKVFYKKEGKLFESKTFTIKSVQHNYIQLNFDLKEDGGYYQRLLQHFTYKARLERKLAETTGILFHLKNELEEGIAFQQAQFRLRKANGDFEDLYLMTDQEGLIIIPLSKGDHLTLVNYNKDCKRLGEKKWEYTFDQSEGIDKQSLQINCPLITKKFKGLDDIFLMDWTTYPGYRISLNSSDLLAKRFNGWTFNYRPKFRALACPSFTGGYENVYQRKVYNWTNSYEYDADGVDDYHDISYENMSYVTVASSKRKKFGGRNLFAVRTRGDQGAYSYGFASDGNASYEDREYFETYGATYQTTLTDSVLLTYGNNVVRKNFADIAYWNPFVITDENGKARYTVTYPDDLTKWKETFIAMDNEFRTGVLVSQVNSFLPISAQLSTPRFLVEGDEAELKTSLINKLSTEVDVNTVIKLNGKELKSKQLTLDRSSFEDIPFKLDDHSIDTSKLSFLFSMEASNGFKDGELREIDLIPQGIEKAEGSFMRIKGDTTFTVNVKENEEIYYHFEQNTTERIAEQLWSVVKYQWDCNEQIASKLRSATLLLNTNLSEKERKSLDKDIRRWIRQLERNQLPSGAWSWWGKGRENTWMTCYIVRALYHAKQAGYEVSGIYRAQKHLTKQCDLAHLNTLVLNTLIDTRSEYSYEDALTKIDDRLERLLYDLRVKIYREQSITASELLQLMSFSKRTLLGSTYWGDEKKSFGSAHLQYTCWALEILRAAGTDEQVEAIEAYLLEVGSNGRTPNTYEATWIGEALLPFLKNSDQQAEFQLIQDRYSSNKRSGILKRGTNTLKIQSDGITYLTVYKKVSYKSPTSATELFDIQTSMIQNKSSIDTLRTAEPVIMRVEVNAKFRSSFVALEIPIPAGCSYDKTASSHSYESHREKDKHMTRIYIEDLKEGKSVYYIPLLPRYSGKYHLNPTQAMQMYFPTLSGNNEVKKVVITN